MPRPQSKKRQEAAQKARDLTEIDGLTKAAATRVLVNEGYYEGDRDYPSSGWITGLLRDEQRRRTSKTRKLITEYVHRGGEPVTDLPKRTAAESGGESLTPSVAAAEYVFTDLEDECPRVPVFTGEPHVEGDCIVTGDFQLPTSDWALCEQVLQVAKATGIKTLLVVGDWVNMDAFSKYDHVVPPIDFVTETQLSVRLMARYATWFDAIWLALGNHEHRLLKAMKGNLSGSMLGRLLSTVGPKLRITPYSHIVIHSGGQTWRATHQVNYSKIKGRVGDELAQKFQSHIITHHQHHAAKLLDRFGRYVIIDNGGLFDSDKMAYVKLRDSTSVAMTKGFTVIIDGTGHLLTPYPAFTNLNLWLRQVVGAGA